MSDAALRFIEGLTEIAQKMGTEHTAPELHSTSPVGLVSYVTHLRTYDGKFLRVVVAEVDEFVWDLAIKRQRGVS